jgi:hypothetical protein
MVNVFLTALAVFLYIRMSFSSSEVLQNLTLGPVEIGEERMKIELQDFAIDFDQKKIQASWIKDSLQWVRQDNILLMPRALMMIKVPSGGFHIRYHQRSWLFQKNNQHSFIQIWVSLFDPEPIKVYRGAEFYTSIGLVPQVKNKGHLIDYSCAPWDVSMEGLSTDFVTMGCRLQRLGLPGSEKPLLEIHWSAASHRLKDQSSPPYVALITHNRALEFQVENSKKKSQDVRVNADLPARLYRLRLAASTGPHRFNIDREFFPNKAQTTATVMLYGNYFLSEKASLRFFNAWVDQIAFFNNAGLYYASEVGEFLDRRFSFTTLLGTQHLTFKPRGGEESAVQMIYPQGAELTWRHPFGQLNKRMTLGGFVDFSGTYNYQNSWLRYGGKYFIEVNFLKWDQNDKSAELWGLSVGMPFLEI